MIMAYVFPHKICHKELAVSIIFAIVTSGIALLIFYQTTWNEKIIHGNVISKEQETVNCEHSHTRCIGSGKHKKCHTWYEHFNDYDWVIHSTIGNFTIDRVDRRGSYAPPRYTNVKIGDYTAKKISYVDYIQNSNSLYNTSKFTSIDPQYKTPSYPNINDYYNVRLALTTDSKYDFVASKISNGLRGYLSNDTKKNNVIVILTQYDSGFAEYLKRLWNKGKWNDTIIVIGLNDNDISLVNSFGWSSDFLLYAKLDTEILNLGKITIDNVEKLIDIVKVNNSEFFKETNMEKFSYLQYDRDAGYFLIFFIIIFQIMLNIGLCYYFYHNETFI